MTTEVVASESSSSIAADASAEVSRRRTVTRLATAPAYAAARVIESAEGKGHLDLVQLMTELVDRSKAANQGDLSHAEAMLVGQATALQSLFATLVERALVQPAMPNLEGFMKLALRAQNQCRATLETLAEIKRPPTIYGAQTNIAHGPQQINNQIPSGKADAIEPTKILEVCNGERMDSGATSAPVGDDSAMATLDPCNRTENRSW